MYDDRQTGRTTRQLEQFAHILAANRTAIYIVGNTTQVRYTLSLAESLGIPIRSSNVVTVASVVRNNGLRGRHRDSIVIDHAAAESADPKDYGHLVNGLGYLPPFAPPLPVVDLGVGSQPR